MGIMSYAIKKQQCRNKKEEDESLKAARDKDEKKNV